VTRIEGLLSALWSFLRHPTAHVEDHVRAMEERLEQDLQSAIKLRLATVEHHLDAVRIRVVERLGQELRRVARIVVMSASAVSLALVGGFFALLGAWLSLKGIIGAVGASFLLAGLFAFLSLAVLAALHSITHQARSQPPQSVRKTAS
jgi:hypothetical protein